MAVISGRTINFSALKCVIHLEQSYVAWWWQRGVSGADLQKWRVFHWFNLHKVSFAQVYLHFAAITVLRLRITILKPVSSACVQRQVRLQDWEDMALERDRVGDHPVDCGSPGQASYHHSACGGMLLLRLLLTKETRIEKVKKTTIEVQTRRSNWKRWKPTAQVGLMCTAARATSHKSDEIIADICGWGATFPRASLWA